MKKAQLLFIIIVLLLAAIVLPLAAVKVDIAPVEKQNFIYYFDNKNYISQADSVLSKAKEKLITLLKDSLSYKPEIYLVADEKLFNRLANGLMPDWGAAAAFPERHLIAVKSPDKFNINKSLEELLVHEYTHLVLAQRCGFYNPPRWLNEGLAIYSSMEWGWSNNVTMNMAAVFGNLMRLPDIEKVNRYNESQANIAYSEAYLAVEYFIKEYGINSLNELLDNIRSGASYNDAFERSTGSSYREFNADFLSHLNNKYNIVSLFMETSFLWIGLAVVVVIGSFIRYKKRRRYFKKWEEEEKLHSTDFDYSDPHNPEQIDDDEPWRS